MQPLISKLQNSNAVSKLQSQLPSTTNLLSKATSKIILSYEEKLADMLLNDVLLDTVQMM